MKHFSLRYKTYGEHSILIEWPQEINELILADILRFKSAIIDSNAYENVQLNHAYTSLLLVFNAWTVSVEEEILKLKALYGKIIIPNNSTFTIWNVPVCYSDEFALDLETVALEKKISKNDLIKLHSDPLYTVYFIGFLPGFLYLGGLRDQLHTPRKTEPRMSVDKGAVAIGGGQTGIYPTQSPGGWHIIGNSPLRFFNAHSIIPCFAKAGDKIKFVPISLIKYNEIKILVDADDYEIESEVRDG